ncbi:MAG: hypothetical protein ACI9VN_002787 [Patescibacteria group bacterium]|jgi:hypothetical protein
MLIRSACTFFVVPLVLLLFPCYICKRTNDRSFFVNKLSSLTKSSKTIEFVKECNY